MIGLISPWPGGCCYTFLSILRHRLSVPSGGRYRGCEGSIRRIKGTLGKVLDIGSSVCLSSIGGVRHAEAPARTQDQRPVVIRCPQAGVLPFDCARFTL